MEVILLGGSVFLFEIWRRERSEYDQSQFFCGVFCVGSSINILFCLEFEVKMQCYTECNVAGSLLQPDQLSVFIYSHSHSRI